MIDDYIVDFYCRKAGLVLELDGSQHYSGEGLEHDRVRATHLEQRGLRVIRISNREIHENFQGICQYIDRVVKAAMKNETVGN